MKNYFTISEFAKLRSIDINSLRYYERLGILTPVYIDPNTRYRYYSAEQLSVLDVILLSVNLGIPLKRLKEYMDENGNFRNRDFFREGKRLTEEKIEDLRACLSRIESTLRYLESTEEAAVESSLYLCDFPPRYLVTEEYNGNMADVNAVERAFTKLFQYACEQKMNPVIPSGVLYRYQGAAVTQYICWEITAPPAEQQSIQTLPAGRYSCYRINWEISTDIRGTAEQIFPIEDDDTIFVSNMPQSSFRFGTKLGEIQKLNRLP